mgnify:CR=1 FL=1
MVLTKSCSKSNSEESTQRGRGSYPLLFDLQPQHARHPNSLRSDMDASSTGAEGFGVKGLVLLCSESFGELRLRRIGFSGIKI